MHGPLTCHYAWPVLCGERCLHVVSHLLLMVLTLTPERFFVVPYLAPVGSHVALVRPSVAHQPRPRYITVRLLYRFPRGGDDSRRLKPRRSKLGTFGSPCLGGGLHGS